MKKTYSIPLWLQVGLNLFTIMIVASLLFASRALAAPASTSQIPGFIPYQGTLVESDGTPITGLIDMGFSLYADPTEGEALWTEAHSGNNAVPVAEGLFNVNLGSITPIPSDLWNQPSLYLGIRVGADDEMTPRQPIGGVPSALQSGVSQLALTVPDGSIGSQQITDGAATSSKVALTHGEVIGTGEVLALTHTPQIVPGLSATVNPATPQVLQLSMTLDAQYYSWDCLTLLAVPSVDGALIYPVMTLWSYPDDGIRSSISSTRQINLSAGPHTIDVRAWCEGTSGAQILSGQSYMSYFLFSQ